MKKLILMLLLCSSTYSMPEKWSDESVTLFTTLTSLSIIDARQIFHMEEYRMYYDKLEPITYVHEINPLIGKSPTVDRVVLVKLLSNTATIYILNKIQEKNRKKVLIWYNALYLIIVLHNASLGLL
jgi:hypothetical protein